MWRSGTTRVTTSTTTHASDPTTQTVGTETVTGRGPAPAPPAGEDSIRASGVLMTQGYAARGWTLGLEVRTGQTGGVAPDPTGPLRGRL